MTMHPISTADLRRFLLPPLLAAAGWVLPPLAGQSAVGAIVEDGASPYASDNGEVIIMMCRQGAAEPLQQMQDAPDDAPLLCLATQVDDDEALRMSPAHVRDLIDRAAQSGGLSVIVLQPQ